MEQTTLAVVRQGLNVAEAVLITLTTFLAFGRGVIVVGQDWGLPAAEIAAAFAPERAQRLVKLNWYGIHIMAELAKASGVVYAQLRTPWCVWLLNAPLGEMALTHDRVGLPHRASAIVPSAKAPEAVVRVIVG